MGQGFSFFLYNMGIVTVLEFPMPRTFSLPVPSFYFVLKVFSQI
jgi:hypothetical protein